MPVPVQTMPARSVRLVLLWRVLMVISKTMVRAAAMLLMHHLVLHRLCWMQTYVIAILRVLLDWLRALFQVLLFQVLLTLLLPYC